MSADDHQVRQEQQVAHDNQGSEQKQSSDMLFGLIADPASDPESLPIRAAMVANLARGPQARRPTYNLEDYVSRPKRKTRSTFVGTFRTLSTISRWEYAYLALSLLSLFGSLIITIWRLAELSDEIKDPAVPASTKADFNFALLLLWTNVFCFYHIVAGIMCERPYDLIVFVITTLVVALYVVLNYFMTMQSSMKLARLILIAVLGPPVVVGGCIYAKRYYVSRSLLFNTVGGNVDMQAICQKVFLLISLLNLDVQFAGSSLILWLQKSFQEPQSDATEMIILGVGIAITIAWVTLGFFAIQREQRSLVYAFFALSPFTVVLNIVNLVRTTEMQKSQQSLLYSVYACGLAAIAIRFACVSIMFIVMRNFGKGLREKIFGGTADPARAAPETRPSPTAAGSNTVDD